MKRELQKIYPLKSCEIRVCELELKGKKIDDVKTVVKAPAEKEAPKEAAKVEKKPEPKAEKKESVKKEETKAGPEVKAKEEAEK